MLDDDAPPLVGGTLETVEGGAPGRAGKLEYTPGDAPLGHRRSAFDLALDARLLVEGEADHAALTGRQGTQLGVPQIGHAAALAIALVQRQHAAGQARLGIVGDPGTGHRMTGMGLRLIKRHTLRRDGAVGDGNDHRMAAGQVDRSRDAEDHLGRRFLAGRAERGPCGGRRRLIGGGHFALAHHPKNG